MQWDDSCDSTRQDKGHKRCVQAKWTKTDSASLAVIIKTSDLSPAQNLRTAYISETLLAVQLGRVPFHDCAYNKGAHMHLFSFSKTVVGLAAIGIASLATAEPLHGPGPGSDWRAPHNAGPAFNPGPRHGHGLPDFAREVWIGSALYFLAAGTYYAWNADQQRYIVVTPPVPTTVSTQSYDVIAYPARGQTPDQQARDRYECHSWAVTQSGFDPATATAAPPSATTDYYRRALTACLAGRGYSVN